MARLFLAAIVVFSLGGCVADDVGGEAVEAGILMSVGEAVAGQGYDEGSQIPNETSVAADMPFWASDYTLPARIYDLRDYPGGIKIPLQDLSNLDVTSQSRTDPGLVERLHPSSEEQIAARNSPAVTENSPPPEPPVSEGVTRNSYLIQLGALPSKESARREWSRIEKRYPDLVRNQSFTIVPFELNPQMGKVFRLRTGSIGEIKSARSLCRKFKSHGQDCFVVKYESPS